MAELLTEPAAALHWEEVLKGLPDLERALTRVQYRKCGPGELVALLAALSRLCARAKQGLPFCESLKSELLRSLMAGLPDLSEALQGWLDAINCEAASAAGADKRGLLVGFDDPAQYPDISSIKADIAQVCRELMALRGPCVLPREVPQVPFDMSSSAPLSRLECVGWIPGVRSGLVRFSLTT